MPVVLSAVPSWPTSSTPQHSTRLSSRRAHVKPYPAATSTALVMPITFAGEGTDTPRVPLPISPEAFAPQHCTAPDCSTAQVCCCPAERSTAGSWRGPGIDAGPEHTAQEFVAPPRCPWLLSPQHRTAPLVVIWHVWNAPAASREARASAQRPSTHTCPAAQAMPQLPQWHDAVRRSKHPSLSGGPHLVSGSSQRKGATHALATQRCPLGQALPQAPQWAALVCVSTQAKLQAVSMRRMGVLIGMMSPFTAQPRTHTESTGVGLRNVAGSMPKRPSSSFCPQHCTSPFWSRAQV
jgi:hypothetical protein